MLQVWIQLCVFSFIIYNIGEACVNPNFIVYICVSGGSSSFEPLTQTQGARPLMWEGF